MIQSAVVIPEEEPREPSPSSLKRRQSSFSPESNKRPRLDAGDINTSSHGSLPPSTKSPPQRKISSAKGPGGADERKRTQRLFGAVFSTLSQTSAKPAHRKRDEIEKRQKEKLKQRDEEVAAEKRRKRAEIDAARREEQKVWDEQGMHLRHQNMRAISRFLKTKSEPHLYYKPWELRDDEEDQIKRQVEENEETIKRELAEHAASKGAETGMNEVHPPVSETPPHTEDREQQPDTTGDGKQELVGAENANKQDPFPIENRPTSADTTNSVPISNTDGTTSVNGEEKVHDDHGGEELVEGQEDDVIY